MKTKDLKELINNFKEPYILNKYQKKNNKIVKRFIDELQNRKSILIDLLNKENGTWNTEFDIEKILNSVTNQYIKLNEENNKKFGIGNIVAITSGDILLQIDLIIKAIISNCRILFILNPILFSFNLYIVSIIQEILRDEGLNKELIAAASSLTYKKQLIDNRNYIDCIIINKDYEEYSYFKERVDSKVIYLDYGNINIYVDSNEFNDEIDKIAKETRKIEFNIYKYDINNVEEFFSNEINNFIFNTVVIFSKDIKKCMRFYEGIKSNNIFINEFNLDKIQIGFKTDDLQFEKNLVIKK